ncbi:MAG TPA: DUF2141 domain-containing protein [Campylobacterales bacterium]|nr:DUF2141 domain-containing protein [Campylobacterales bacterium]HIP40990.1 DUF2141 domain-containing protein [Campylobacterales bacterium]
MNKLIVSTLLTSSLLFSATINIEVSHIKNQKGSLVIGLYNIEKTFPIKTEEYKGATVEINSTVATYQFQNIPDGSYAIALFHDENSNEILDKNFLGIPKEGYGFSNNAKALFSAPSFDEAKFELNNSIDIKIEMDY